MPVIAWAHICNYARIDRSGLVSLMDIFDNINSRAAPTRIPHLYIVVAWNGNVGEHFDSQIRVSNASGDALHESPKRPITFQRQSDYKAKSHILMHSVINLALPEFGEYSVEILADGITVHSLPFALVRADYPKTDR